MRRPQMPNTTRSVALPTITVMAALAAGCGRSSAAAPARADTPRLMTPADLQALPSRPPTRRVSYGADSSQFGELRIPTRRGPHPVAVLIHGGCFKATYADRRDLAPMGDILAAEGIATWNIEYRRVGHPGGGWPGTYLDVGRAVDHLRTLAAGHALDLSRVVVVGHSAGGHLAMWTAARHRLPPESPLHSADPLPIRGVVNLAGPVDLTANIEGYESLCRDTIISGLMGGTPDQVPERYAHASAIRHVPLGVPQLFVIGDHEDFVPQRFAEAYVRTASAAGDSIRLLVLPRTGHFEVAMPTTEALLVFPTRTAPARRISSKVIHAYTYH
jgi:acetyl esterase/lipase